MGTFQPRVTTTTNRRIHTQGDSSTSSQSINSTPTVSMHQTQQQSSNGQAGQQPTSSLTQQQTQQQQQQQHQQQQVQSQGGSGQSQGQSQPQIQQQQQTSLSVQGQAAPVRSTMVTTQVQQPTMTMTGPPQQPQPHQMLPPVPQSRLMATSPMPTTMQYNPHNQTSVQSPLVLATPAPPPPQAIQHQPPPPPTPVNYGAVTPYAPRPQSMVLPPDPSVILPYLLLGGSFTNKNPEIIYYMRISHIINMAVELPPSYHLANLAYNRNIIYKHLPSDDSLQYNIRVHFEDAFQMIDAARMSNGRALVHCMMGISRSATVVIAYLMSRYNMSMRDAYLWVKSRRPEIQPNPLFLRILEDFERDLIQQRIKNDYVARSMYNNRTTTTAAAAPVAPVTVIEPHDKRYYHMPKNVIIKPAATQMLALPAPPTPHTTTYTMQHTSPGMPTQTMTYHHPHHPHHSHNHHHTNTIPGPIIITQHRPNMRPQSYVGYPNYAY